MGIGFIEFTVMIIKSAFAGLWFILISVLTASAIVWTCWQVWRLINA